MTPARAPPAGGAAQRELEVLELVARGRSNSEIAGELHLSTATVKTRVTRILAKLGLRDRVPAVVLATRAVSSSPAARPERAPCTIARGVQPAPPVYPF